MRFMVAKSLGYHLNMQVSCGMPPSNLLKLGLNRTTPAGMPFATGFWMSIPVVMIPSAEKSGSFWKVRRKKMELSFVISVANGHPCGERCRPCHIQNIVKAVFCG